VELVAAAERDSKRQAWQLADHFKKLLEATCPNHMYLVRHKLKECTMMKNYMTTGIFAKGKSPDGDSAGKVAALSPRRKWSCRFTEGQPTMSHGANSSLLAERSTL
jgi:hypothetical protein